MVLTYGAATSETLDWRSVDITRVRPGTEFRGFRSLAQFDQFAVLAGAQALALSHEQPVNDAAQFFDSDELWCNGLNQQRRAPSIGALMTSAPIGDAFDLRKLRVMTVRPEIALPVR